MEVKTQLNNYNRQNIVGFPKNVIFLIKEIIYLYPVFIYPNLGIDKKKWSTVKPTNPDGASEKKTFLKCL